MISVNATLFMQAIHFLLLIFILNRLMFRPILRVIEDRRQYIQEAMSKVVSIEEETTSLAEKYTNMEKTAIRDAGNESSRLRKEAMALAEKIFNETRNEVNSIRGRVGQEIDSKIAKARQSLEDEANILADTIIEKFTGRGISN